MASTYVNNLRLNEMATGDASGTWGTTTNTNLELVGQALGYGTEAITTNADTHASTVADGAADEARAMYIKYTGTLDSACTITIGPNTLKRVHIIENATSGSQSIIIKQGSGATVTIPTGRVAVVFLDGAGSGAAVTNAFTDLDLAGTLSISGAVAAATDMTVGDDLTLSSDAGVLGFGADTDVTLTHVADTGLLLNSSRQLQFGDSGTYIHQSADGVLDLVADTEIEINATTIDINGAVDISGNALVSGEVQTANIGYTDGDNAITIADGGGITAAAGITSTAAANTLGATSFNDANITNVGSIALDSIINDATDVSIDVAGKILLSADNAGQIELYDGSLLYGLLAEDNSNFLIRSIIDNEDILFQGYDASSLITALTLDMSEAGAATFNNKVIATELDISGDIDVDGTSNLDVVDIDGDVDMAATLTVGTKVFMGGLTLASNDAGRIGLNRNPDNGASVSSASLERFQINGPYSGGDYLDFQNYDSSGNYTGGFRLDDGALITVPVAGKTAVFNENGNDVDFRIESDAKTHMFAVDGENNRIGINNSTPTKTLDVRGVPYISSSGFAFHTLDKEITSGTADFTFSELNGECSDNFSYLIIVSVYNPSTSTTFEHASYIGHRMTPRGGGGSLTQISSIKASGIGTFTVAALNDGIRVTTDTSPTLHARLIMLGGGGTSVPNE